MECPKCRWPVPAGVPTCRACGAQVAIAAPSAPAAPDARHDPRGGTPAADVELAADDRATADADAGAVQLVLAAGIGAWAEPRADVPPAFERQYRAAEPGYGPDAAQRWTPVLGPIDRESFF